MNNETNTPSTMENYTTTANSLDCGDVIRTSNGQTFKVEDAGWDEVSVNDGCGGTFLVDPNEIVEVLTCLVY